MHCAAWSPRRIADVRIPSGIANLDSAIPRPAKNGPGLLAGGYAWEGVRHEKTVVLACGSAHGWVSPIGLQRQR